MSKIKFYRAVIVLSVTVFFMTTGTWGQESSKEEVKPSLSTAVTLGYSSGFNIQASLMISDFARDFPMSARLGIGISSVEPGNPAEARRIFINNATNGIPEEKGSQWDFRLDLLHPVHLLSMKRAYLYGGLRYAKFKGNFKYVGGNEDFDVISKHWGIGTGLESHFPMGSSVDLILTGGIDYFLSSKLAGHDTSYSPDEDPVNPREEYTYDDADEAINQPKIEFRLMLGFAYHF